MKPFDPTKPCQARDGRKVRILCTDGPNPLYPIVGFVEGFADANSWTKNGNFYVDRNQDAKDPVNIPTKRKLTGRVNVYKSGEVFYHAKKQDAELNRNNDVCIACLDLSKYNIEFEEGEGL